MSILPRVLYVFQTIPVGTPRATIRKLQDLIQNFVWAGKRPRMRKDLAYQSLDERGLGIPNLLAYYQAAQLRYLVEWNRPESEKRWLFQDGAMAPIDLWKIPFLNPKDRPKYLTRSPITKTVMQVWATVSTKRGLTTFPSLMTPLFDNPEFEPRTDRRAFAQWRSSECRSAGHLFHLDGFFQLLDLTQYYSLQHPKRYQYFQLRHWLMHPEVKPLVGRKMTAYKKWLVTKDTDRHLITELYQMLNPPSSKPRSAGQARCDRELGRELSDKEWREIHYRANHTMRNTASREAAVKVAMYWYLTPARLHKGNSDRSPTCWRGCDEEGTLTHILWDCREVKDFWVEVLEIDKHFETTIPRFPDYALLGLPNPLTFPLKSIRGKQMGLAMG